jgi:hypothetical protein
VLIFTRANFVNVVRAGHRDGQPLAGAAWLGALDSFRCETSNWKVHRFGRAHRIEILAEECDFATRRSQKDNVASFIVNANHSAASDFQAIGTDVEKFKAFVNAAAARKNRARA